MKKNKFFKAMGVAALAACTMATSVMGVYAADTDLIDTTKTASLYITKYDLSAASAAGITGYAKDGNGEVDTTTEDALAKYALQGVEFTYLKVADITQVSDGGEVYLEYDLPDALDAILGLGTDAHTADDINTALSAILTSGNTSAKNALESYVTSNGGTTMTETGADGKTSATGLDLGLYLVVETAVPEEVYSTTDPFFVSLPMTDVTGDHWNYDVYVYPKNQTNNPTMDKLVKDNDTGAAFADTATASEGETVTYRIVTKLPSITSEATYLTQFKYVDTLSDGLAYQNDAKVELYLSSNGATLEQIQQGTASADATWDDSTNMTVTSDTDANTVTVDVNSTGLGVINSDYSDGYMVVTYTALVTSDADVVLGDDGNPNDVKLTYRRTNETYTNTIEDKSIVYTYGINLTKTFDNENGDPTAVQFVLQNYTHATETDGYYLVATGSDGVYYVTGTSATEDGATQFSPASDGKLIINGLEADTYVMTETKTDDGYSLLKESMTIVINGTTASITPVTAANTGSEQAGAVAVTTTAASATVDGDETNMSADDRNTEDTGDDSANARVDMSVLNNSSFTLPQTGGMGTILFSIAGAIAVALGIVYVGRSRKTAKD